MNELTPISAFKLTTFLHIRIFFLIIHLKNVSFLKQIASPDVPINNFNLSWTVCFRWNFHESSFLMMYHIYSTRNEIYILLPEYSIVLYIHIPWSSSSSWNNYKTQNGTIILYVVHRFLQLYCRYLFLWHDDDDVGFSVCVFWIVRWIDMYVVHHVI